MEGAPMLDAFFGGLPFLRYAFIVGLLASIAFGIIGTFVVTRRITSIAGAIAHCVLGGIGVALFFRNGYDVKWSHPLLGAIIAAIIAALVIGFVSIYAKQREDTIIGAIWAIGMAVGLLFIAKTPGEVGLDKYLFGNILYVSQDDIYITLLLDIVIILPAILLFNNILGVCFDSDFSELRGVKVKFIYFTLLIMTALTIVLMVNIVGIIMVIAMLTLPAAVAGQFTKRLWSMMVLSVVLSIVFTSSGLLLSYNIEMPSGPMIVVIAGVCYLASIIYKRFKRSA
jgi:zinc transport system permease protein